MPTEALHAKLLAARYGMSRATAARVIAAHHAAGLPDAAHVTVTVGHGARRTVRALRVPAAGRAA
jgi:hypothetical protein